MLASGDHEAKSRAPLTELPAVAQWHDPVLWTVDDHPFGIRARPNAEVPPGRRQEDQRPLIPDRKGNRPASRHPNDHVGPQSIMGTLGLPNGRPKPPIGQLRAFDLKPKPPHKRRLAAGPRHPAGENKRPRDPGAIRHFLGVRWPHGGSLPSSVSSRAFLPGSCPSFRPISSSRENRTHRSPPSASAENTMRSGKTECHSTANVKILPPIPMRDEIESHRVELDPSGRTRLTSGRAPSAASTWIPGRSVRNAGHEPRKSA